MHDSEYDFDKFCDQHRMQLVMSGVPSIFWPALHQKLKTEKFDAGEHFSMIWANDSDHEGTDENDKAHASGFDDVQGNQNSPADLVNNNNAEVRKYKTVHKGSVSGSGCQISKWKVIVCNVAGISALDGSKIFLIDHALTFKPNDVRAHLMNIPGLLDRMSSLTDVDNLSGLSLNSAEILDCVTDRLWLYSQTYTVNRDDADLEEKLSVWYIMDEFGSRIRHNDNPKFRTVPFYYIPQQILYSLLFPISDAQYGDEVTRDFVEGTVYHKEDWRGFYLFPWFPNTWTHIPVEFSSHDDSYFQSSQLISAENVNSDRPADIPAKKNHLKVYTDFAQIVKHLKSAHFELTDDADQADVWWLQSHFRDFNTLAAEKPAVLINQFPYESVLTVKDLLAAAVHLRYADEKVDERTLEFKPAWFSTTFNLKTELPQFISYFQKREEMDLDNTWIIKPWNLARGLDIYVTDSLRQIIRLIDSGPKIACKYVEDPVLFHRDDLDSWVKFDLRFIVLLKSVEPLDLYVYKPFWLRFALKEFSLEDFYDIEKHFTVFNYLNKSKILQMRYENFIEQFSIQYPGHQWDEIQAGIYEIIKETFQIATKFPPPKGLANFQQSRAMYGVDVMLKWVHDERGKYIQPVLLEVNYMPDCERACDYYPDFANVVFETLFLDDDHLKNNSTTAVSKL